MFASDVKYRMDTFSGSRSFVRNKMYSKCNIYSNKKVASVFYGAVYFDPATFATQNMKPKYFLNCVRHTQTGTNLILSLCPQPSNVHLNLCLPVMSADRLGKQTVWTQIRPYETSGRIRVQIVWHSDCIPERIISKN